MPKPSSSLIKSIYQMAGVHRDDTRSDAELIKRYGETRDEQAFSALMVRHGGMVWSICRRILTNTPDVEEAYQTTFLTLACKANKVRINVVGWLHQVAHRTAMAARREIKAHRAFQKDLKDSADAQLPHSSVEPEIHEELHNEIAKLTEKLRVALVLHFLEGRTQAEVAEILGLEESAVWHRLARGKAILEKRLAQKGFLVGSATVGTLFGEFASHAAPPAGLITKTVKMATAFRDGELSGKFVKLAVKALKNAPSTMPWWKSGWLIIMLCVSGAGVGLGCFTWQSGIFSIGAGGRPTCKRQETSLQSKNDKVPSRLLDLYGDPLPPGALARLGTTRLRHAVGGGVREASGFLCEVRSMSFTSDGKGLLTAGMGNPPRLWNVADGKLLRQFGNLPPELVVGVALSRDGRLLACREGNRSPLDRNLRKGNLHIWETATGRLVRTLEGGPDDQTGVNCSFSPDSNLIAARVQNGLGVWETASGQKLWMQDGVGANVLDVAYSPDGKIVAVADERSSQVVLRDARTGRELRVVLYRGWVNLNLAFSPDGTSLLLSASGRLSLWDVNSGKERWKGAGKYPVFSTDGKAIAIYERSLGFIQLLDASSGEQMRRWLGGDGFSPLAFSPDGKTIAYARGPVVHFCDSASGGELPCGIRAHESTISSICFLLDNETLVSGGDDGALRVWNSWTGRERQVFSSEHCSHMMGFTDTYQPAFSSALSPDGKTLAASFLKSKKEIKKLNDLQSVEESACTDLRLWNAQTGRELPGFRTSEGTWLLKRMVYSPNSKFLAATLKHSRPLGEELIVWDLTTGKQYGLRLPGFQPAFSPDGSLLLGFQNEAGKERSWIKFSEFTTGKTVHEIKLEKAINSMALSPQRGMLAVTTNRGANHGITVVSLDWEPEPRDVRHGALREIDFSSASSLQTCTFSPDGRLLAVGGDDKIVHVLEISSGKERAQFRGHIGSVTVLCFSKDGKRLVSGGVDGEMLVWDLTDRLRPNGDLRPLHCSESELERFWKELGDADTISAGRVIWKLTAADQASVALLKRYLQPVEAVASLKEINQLLAGLDADVFQVRKGAHDALIRIGAQCETSLREVLTKKTSVEKRRVLESLLAMWESQKNAPSKSMIHRLRAVEVLENIGTQAAQDLLRKLASGAAGDRLTQESQAALNRSMQAQRRQKDCIMSAKRLQP